MFVYCVLPIDFWSGWQKPSDVFKLNDGLHDEARHDAAEWRPMWEKAKTLASDVGWEGDIRAGEGPFVSVLPSGDGGAMPPVVIAWKQDNNGTTFVASPIRLPWLEDGGNWVEG